MKLVAHSTIPSTPLPYMHLGYISAVNNWYTGKGDTIVGLFAMSIIGIVLAFRFHKKAVGLFGIALVIVGVAGLGLLRWNAGTSKQYLHPRKVTEGKLGNIQNQIDNYYVADTPLPRDIKTLVRELRLKPEEFKDAWFRPIRYVAGSKQGDIAYQLISAGDDGIFVTKDDMILTVDRQGEVSFDKPLSPQPPVRNESSALPEVSP